MYSSQSYAGEGDTLFYKDDYSIVVDSIIIEGNVQTQDFIILRELTFDVGDVITNELAQYNRERIYSLDIFNEVKLIPFKTKGINFLLISIEESWYIYPLPVLTLKERDWKKISYGLALSIKNFRGRNESITGVLTFGYDPSLSLSYFNPYLIRKLDIYSHFQLGFTDVSNKSKIAERLAGKKFSHKFYYGKIFIGKRFGLYHRLSVSAGFDYVETPFNIEGLSASNTNIDRTIILGISYNYDTRDLVQYASNGILAGANYEFKGMGLNNINYRIAEFEFREYRKLIGGLVGKWRIAARFSNGKVPYYDYSFLGLAERIRGHWDEQMEGNDIVLGSLELDYWILNDFRMNFYWIPLLPKSLLSYRVCFIWELFVDSGTARINGESFALNRFSTGYGTGFSILFLPYLTMRFEFAVNNNLDGQWIFDLGTSF